MVPILLPWFALVSVSVSWKGPCCKRSQKQPEELEPSARLSDVNLLSGTAASASPSSLSSAGWKPSSLVKSSSMGSSALVSLLQDSYLEILPLLFCHTHNLSHDFLDWLCHKSCEVMHNIWTVFSSRNLLFWA